MDIFKLCNKVGAKLFYIFNTKQYREVLPKDVSIFCQCQKLQSYAKKWDFLKNLIYSSDIVELKFFYILGSVDFLRALRTRN